MPSSIQPGSRVVATIDFTEMSCNTTRGDGDGAAVSSAPRADEHASISISIDISNEVHAGSTMYQYARATQLDSTSQQQAASVEQETRKNEKWGFNKEQVFFFF